MTLEEALNEIVALHNALEENNQALEKLEEKVESLGKIIKDLTSRLEKQEKKNPWDEILKPKPQPYIPPITPNPWTPPPMPWAPPWTPNVPKPYDTTLPKCVACGIVFSGPVGYVCTRSDCPSGKVTCETAPHTGAAVGVAQQSTILLATNVSHEHTAANPPSLGVPTVTTINTTLEGPYTSSVVKVDVDNMDQFSYTADDGSKPEELEVIFDCNGWEKNPPPFVEIDTGECVKDGPNPTCCGGNCHK
jgi:hypothetical protein